MYRSACYINECCFRHGIWFAEQQKSSQHSQPKVQQFARTTKALSSDSISKINNAIVSWVVMDCRPISIAKDDGFVNLMKIATGCDTYSPPCYATITDKMHYMYVDHFEKVKTKLQAAPAVSLTADFWTSAQNKAYIGITVHYVDGWILRSCVLDVFEVPESHTAKVCGDALVKTVEKFDILDKVICIVTDRGRNIVKGVEEHTPFLNTNCFGHIIQRGIVAGLKAADMEGLLIKCRKIVGHFKHSAIQTTRLSEAAQELELSNLALIQDVATRWFSILAMAERLVSQRDAVNTVLEENGYPSDMMLSAADFGRLDQIVKVFTPFKEISDFLGGEKYVTGSCVVHAVRKLESFLLPSQEDPMYIASFKRAFSSYFDLNIRIPPLLKTCSALDPRFNKLKSLNDMDKDNINECLLTAMKASMTNCQADTSDIASQASAHPSRMEFSILDNDDDSDDDGGVQEDINAIVQAELAAFRARKSEPLTANPLLFWKQHSASYPNLAQQAAKLLSVPATSLPCERLFSVAGILIDKRRTALNPEHVQKILCLNSWLKCEGSTQ